MNMRSIKKLSLALIFIVHSATSFGMQNPSKHNGKTTERLMTLKLLFQYVPNPKDVKTEDVKTIEEFIDYCRQYFKTNSTQKLSEIPQDTNNHQHPFNTPYAKSVCIDEKKCGGNLMDTCFGKSALLHEAIEQENEIRVWLLIKKEKANVNLGKSDFGEIGETPLYSAVRKGNLSIVRLLVEAGANPNAPEENRKTTPRSLAKKRGKQEIIDYFEKL